MGDCPTLLRSEVPAVLWGLFPFLTRCFGTAHLGPDTPHAKSLSCHVTGLEPFYGRVTVPCYEQTLVRPYGLGSLLYALGIVQKWGLPFWDPSGSLLYASV